MKKEERVETPTSFDSETSLAKENVYKNKPAKHKIESTTSKMFKFGNYDRYYGYRLKNQKDARLEIFQDYPFLFDDQEILDVGCNNGMISIEIAKMFSPKSVVGLDIDKKLIKRAKQLLQVSKKADSKFNCVVFQSGNYIVQNEVLINAEKEQFDTIVCLSVTKWMHLNEGDVGLKQAFKRMFKQLRSGGRLILEAQPFSSYRKRKHLSPEIYQNYINIKLKPVDFENYLMSSEIGFRESYFIKEPEPGSKGFNRPIQVFVK